MNHKLENDITADVGVIIGRFQVDDLHQGHIDIIQQVCDRHDRVLILIGTTTILSTKRNPLDYISRELMIKSKFPNVFISDIRDIPHSDEEWSKSLDNEVRKKFPNNSILLYGSRDSFIKYYSGKFDCVELDSVYTATGSDIREKIGKGVFDDKSFRAGQIYSFFNTYQSAISCVDVAIINHRTDEVLLGRKTGRSGYCFVGGFVDTTDTNYEHAARREVMEETGLVIDSFQYIGNHKIDDLRYRNESNKIFSTLFVGTYVHGKPCPDDDMNELRWFKLSELDKVKFVDAHKPLYNILRNNYLIPYKSFNSLSDDTSMHGAGYTGSFQINMDDIQGGTNDRLGIVSPGHISTNSCNEITINESSITRGK